MTEPLQIQPGTVHAMCACDDDGSVDQEESHVPWEHAHEDGSVRKVPEPLDPVGMMTLCKDTGESHPYTAWDQALVDEVAPRLADAAERGVSIVEVPPAYCHMLIAGHQEQSAFVTSPTVRIVCSGDPSVA